MTRLSVNVNKIATLRNTRPIGIPSPLRLSKIALEAGAHGITVHPRPDGRHIRPGDVTELAQLLRSWPDREFNIEGNPFHGYIELVREARPDQATLVPDEVAAATSDHGWDLLGDTSKLAAAIIEVKRYSGRVSLFMDTDREDIERQFDRAAELGADRVELYTAPYADAFARGHLGMLAQFTRAAEIARAAGLAVNAGHDLSLLNLPPLVRAIPFLAEVSIGHALIGDALEFGLAETVRKYLAAVAS